MPEVLRRHRAVGLLADDQVALLGAQHVHRLGAVRRHAERLAGGHSASHSSRPWQAGDVDLERQLAGEARRGRPRRRDAGDRRRRDRHEREARRAERSSRGASGASRSREPGADDGHRRPLLGDRRQRTRQVAATRSAATPPSSRARRRRCRSSSWSRNRSSASAHARRRRRRPCRRPGTSGRSGARPTSSVSNAFVYMRFRNSAASGPWTSILPSVEASIMADAPRGPPRTRAARLRPCPRRRAG